MAKVPLKAVLRECRRRNICFGDELNVNELRQLAKDAQEVKHAIAAAKIKARKCYTRLYMLLYNRLKASNKPGSDRVLADYILRANDLPERTLADSEVLAEGFAGYLKNYINHNF